MPRQAIAACASPPRPMAAAPIAAAPTSGAKVAAVPVVPQIVEAAMMAATPRK